VRDARRLAPELAARLGAPPALDEGHEASDSNASVANLRVTYGGVRALEDITVSFAPATITAVMGRNGSGKSTLLGALAGMRQPRRGSVRVCGEDPVRLGGRQRIGRVGLVPQDSGSLLYAETVAEECASADRDASLPPGSTRAVLDRLVAGVPDDRHPRDLSEGQRLALALALVIAPEPAVLLADEPTRGLDYPAKAALVSLLAAQASQGRTVVIATHDVEFVAQLAHRVVVLAQGEVVADGPAREVVCHSPVFAPQVAKVLAPAPWLTVEEVRAALETREPAT
jgi:energy-coupling factor transport system ATP-binding protein